MQTNEILIRVPYGHLAAKTWGDSADEPILALHGWQDNAASFDALVPLLPQKLYIVCLDFSGHGLSSHKPPGCHYNAHEYLLDVLRAVDFLQWGSFSILGHSLGCAVGLYFTNLYPDKVKCFVGLDLLTPLLCRDEDLVKSLRENLENYLDIECKMAANPAYDEADLISRMKKVNPCELTDDAVKILLSRGTSKTDNGKLQFRRDVRTRILRTVVLTPSAAYSVLSNYKGNLLMVVGSKSEFGHLNKNKQKFIDLYEKSCKCFKLEEVNGGHYVHLNQPELVADVVTDFWGKVLLPGV